MAEQTRRSDEPLDKVLRKFKKKVKEEGIFDEVKKREFFEKPSESKKRRNQAASRRNKAKQDDDLW
jgi:small subunit ribosomal protein S21